MQLPSKLVQLLLVKNQREGGPTIAHETCTPTGFES